MHVKVLIMVLSYEAENHIIETLDRVDFGTNPNVSYDVAIFDDASKDGTIDLAINYNQYPLKVFKNKKNLGYGGNQKKGYEYAIKNGYDFVVMLHGDGQYPPEKISEMVSNALLNESDAVFGSRMINKAWAIKGGMPLYKFFGNIILTKIQNILVGTNLSEFHTGFRLYKVKSLMKLPYLRNSDVFDFDTDIIIQLAYAGMKITEIPIPTRYGEEVCRVDGIKYAKDIVRSSIHILMQKLGLRYDERFIINPGRSKYTDKLDYISSHKVAIERLANIYHKTILDIGSGFNFIVNNLQADKLIGVYIERSKSDSMYDEFIVHNLNNGMPVVNCTKNIDVVVMLDVIQHLVDPIAFLDSLYCFCCSYNVKKLLISTPNVVFLPNRVMMNFGRFEYSERGIMSISHLRFFTHRTFVRSLQVTGFRVENCEGIVAPFRKVFKSNTLCKILEKINRLMIKVLPGVFSYQIFVVASPKELVSTKELK